MIFLFSVWIFSKIFYEVMIGALCCYYMQHNFEEPIYLNLFPNISRNHHTEIFSLSFLHYLLYFLTTYLILFSNWIRKKAIKRSMRWNIRRFLAVFHYVYNNNFLSIVKVNFYDRKQLALTIMNLRER